MKQLAVIVPVILALTACGSDPVPEPDGDGAVSGEVLEGTISDAMLPLDTVQSQSPALEKVPSEDGDSDAATADEDDAEESEPAPEAEETASEE